MIRAEALKILGLSRDSSDDDIKAAYRKLAKQYHPDVNKEQGAEAKFKEITEAYSVLTQKTETVAGLKFDEQGGFGEFNDFFKAFFRETSVNRAHQAHPKLRPIKVNDIKLELQVSLYQYLYEEFLTFKIVTKKPCSICLVDSSYFSQCRQCDGYGTIETQVPTPFGMHKQVKVCNYCKGSGYNRSGSCTSCKNTLLEDEEQTIKWRFPSGFEFNKPVLFKGKGHKGHLTNSSNLYIIPKLIRPRLNNLSISEMQSLKNLLSKI
jgi:molecular chaperone DnaJ